MIFLTACASFAASFVMTGCSTPAKRSSTERENRVGLFRAFASVSESPNSPKDDLMVRTSGATDWKAPLDLLEVTSFYGKRHRDFHEGVDFKADVGSPVYAVDSGVVAYAGNKIRGYGRMIILAHNHSGLATVYAHHSKNFVKKGQKIKRGQLIAHSGRSGHVTGPHLHFEVRKGSDPIDPLPLLKRMRPRLANVDKADSS